MYHQFLKRCSRYNSLDWLFGHLSINGGENHVQNHTMSELEEKYDCAYARSCVSKLNLSIYKKISPLPFCLLRK